LASGLALFVFASGIRMVFALAMPLLIALMRHWPRLACLGLLLLWLSPVAVAAAIHNLVGRVIGASAPASRDAWLGGAASWWAGFVAWAAIIVVTITMVLVAVVLEPPPIVDPECVWNVVTAVTNGGAGAARSVIWILLAAYVYELELRARNPVLPA
jgi:hypothetical protein